MWEYKNLEFFAKYKKIKLLSTDLTKNSTYWIPRGIVKDLLEQNYLSYSDDPELLNKLYNAVTNDFTTYKDVNTIVERKKFFSDLHKKIIEDGW